MKFSIVTVCFMIMSLFITGCEIQDVPDGTTASTGTASQTSPTADSAQTADATATAGTDAEWESIQWHGKSCAGATVVMSISASMSSSNVRFSFSSYPWGGEAGLAHFFFWNGTTWEGGKFDWIRAGGQGIKTLTNIRGGYNGLHAPASGTPVAFAWTNADGTQRSNLAKTVWP